MASVFDDLIEKRLREAEKRGEKRGKKRAKKRAEKRAEKSAEKRGKRLGKRKTRLEMALYLLEYRRLSTKEIAKVCNLSHGLVKKMKSEWDY